MCEQYLRRTAPPNVSGDEQAKAPLLAQGGTDGALRLERGIAMIFNESQRLDDGQAEQVTGGYIHISFGGEHPGEWEVVDDFTGEVLARYEFLREAEDAADRLGMSTRKISTTQLKMLQNGEL